MLLVFRFHQSPCKFAIWNSLNLITHCVYMYAFFYIYHTCLIVLVKNVNTIIMCCVFIITTSRYKRCSQLQTLMSFTLLFRITEEMYMGDFSYKYYTNDNSKHHMNTYIPHVSICTLVVIS